VAVVRALAAGELGEDELAAWSRSKNILSAPPQSG
jgi:hypothetical protein